MLPELAHIESLLEWPFKTHHNTFGSRSDPAPPIQGGNTPLELKVHLSQFLAKRTILTHKEEAHYAGIIEDAIFLWKIGQDHLIADRLLHQSGTLYRDLWTAITHPDVALYGGWIHGLSKGQRARDKRAVRVHIHHLEESISRLCEIETPDNQPIGRKFAFLLTYAILTRAYKKEDFLDVLSVVSKGVILTGEERYYLYPLIASRVDIGSIGDLFWGFKNINRGVARSATQEERITALTTLNDGSTATPLIGDLWECMQEDPQSGYDATFLYGVSLFQRLIEKFWRYDKAGVESIKVLIGASLADASDQDMIDLLMLLPYNLQPFALMTLARKRTIGNELRDLIQAKWTDVISNKNIPDEIAYLAGRAIARHLTLQQRAAWLLDLPDRIRVNPKNSHFQAIQQWVDGKNKGWMDRRFGEKSRARYPSRAMTEIQMIASIERSGRHKEALQAIYRKWRKGLSYLQCVAPDHVAPFHSTQAARAYVLFRLHKPDTQRRDTTGQSYVLQSASHELDTLPKDFRRRIIIQSCDTNKPSGVRAMLLSHKLTEQEYFVLLTRQKKTSYSSYAETESAFRSPHTPAWLRLAMCLEPKKTNQSWWYHYTPSLPDLQYVDFNPTGVSGIAWMEAYSATQARYFRRLLREEGWDLPRRFARQYIEPLVKSNHPIRMLRRWAKEWKPK